MAVDYKAPISDMAFLVNHVVDAQTVFQLPGYDECTPDVVQAILEEAAKFANEVISPLNIVSDTHGATLNADHSVTTSPGFAQAYAGYADAGWNSLGGRSHPRRPRFARAFSDSHQRNVAQRKHVLCTVAQCSRLARFTPSHTTATMSKSRPTCRTWSRVGGRAP